jgi:ribosomal protein S18 acetylase RimI-like enzyme
MLIRLVRESDLPVCGRIYAAAFSVPPYRERWSPDAATEMLTGLLQRDPESCWCVEDEEEVIGFAFCTSFGKWRATIQEFAVAPGHQGQGIGTSLMLHALADFRSRGIRAADLVVNRQAPAFGFYRKLGFNQPRDYTLMIRSL